MNKLDRKFYFPVLVLFIFIATFCAGRTALANDNNTHSSDQHLETQSERLDEIEEIVSEQKKLIEESFAFSVRGVQDSEIDYLRQVERLSYKLSSIEKRILISLV